MSNKKNSFSITAIIIEDHQKRGFTSYFAEFPEIIADGATEEEAKENLMEAFKFILLTRKEESAAEAQTDLKPFMDQKIKTENFEFELA